MQRIVPYATDVYFYLSKISSDIYFFIFGYLPSRHLYFCEQGCEDL